MCEQTYINMINIDNVNNYNSQIHKLVINYLNLLFGNNERSINYWNMELRREILSRFPPINNQDYTSNIQKYIIPFQLFYHLSKKLGLIWDKNISELVLLKMKNLMNNDINENDEKIFYELFPLNIEQLTDIEPTVKYLQFINFIPILRDW